MKVKIVLVIDDKLQQPNYSTDNFILWTDHILKKKTDVNQEDLFVLNIFVFILFMREMGDNASWAEAERGERESQAGPALAAQSQTWDSNPRRCEIMT